MKNYRIAVLGSTGVVGREMIRLIEAGGIPAELVPLGSARSAGSTIEFHGEPVTVREATGNSFFGADFVLGAAKNAVARLFAPAIAESGAVFIDNSSAFRLMDDVPLVVPEINGADAFFASRHNRKPELLHDNRAHGSRPAQPAVEDRDDDRVHLSGGLRRGTGGTDGADAPDGGRCGGQKPGEPCVPRADRVPTSSRLSARSSRTAIPTRR